MRSGSVIYVYVTLRISTHIRCYPLLSATRSRYTISRFIRILPSGETTVAHRGESHLSLEKP